VHRCRRRGGGGSPAAILRWHRQREARRSEAVAQRSAARCAAAASGAGLVSSPWPRSRVWATAGIGGDWDGNEGTEPMGRTGPNRFHLPSDGMGFHAASIRPWGARTVQ
jgi:hypothetical protein